MANLPEKNITTVDKITSIPSNTNLYINANGEFRQATIDDVLKASPVIADSIANQYKNASGSPILLTDSAKGVAIDFNAKGRSTQAQYSGKNLANVKDKTSGTVDGITSSITNEVVTASGTSTGSGDILISLSTNVVMESGTDYTISIQEITGTIPSYFTVYLYDVSTSIFSNYAMMSTSNSSVIFNLTDTIECSGLLFRINANNTINGTFRLQIEKGTTKTDYEPYVGGTASPNPEYPQAIKSVGDMGYFDGELLQGYYSTSSSGVFVSNSNSVSSKNAIPCNSGDSVKLEYYGDNVENTRLLFYDESGTYISGSLVESAEITLVAPTNASYCHFTVYTSNTLTPQTAKHICVTINGKYALIVKCIGKNLLNINEIDKDTRFFSYTKYTNEIVKATANVTTRGSFICSFSAYLEKGKRYIFSQESTNLNSAYIYSDRLWGNNIGVVDVVTAPNYTHNADSGIYIIGYYGAITSGTEYSIVKPMLRPAEVTDGTYEPYKEEVKYTPISSPLRGIGEVTDVASLGKCEVTRRIIKKRITQVYKNNGTNANNYCYYATIGNVGKSGVGLSNTLSCVSLSELASDGTENIGQYVSDEYGGVVYMNVGKHLTENTVEGMTKWLSENPTYIQYELAEPITETIEPVDIVTYDNVTYLTASDNADMEIEYPTTKVAGIASIGWSKGRRAEYDLEQLKAQMLALQTTIVSTV